MKRILSFTILGLLFFSCKSSESLNGQDFAQKLKTILHASKKQIKAIDFKKYTSFEWSKVHIFAPYTSSYRIKTAIGSQISSNIENYDNIYLIVFLLDNKVVASIDLERDVTDFDFVKTNSMKVAQKGILKNEAIFSVLKTNNQVTLIH